MTQPGNVEFLDRTGAGCGLGTMESAPP
jgi:hypothetical protein